MKKGRLIKEYQRFIEDFDFNETPEAPELETGEEGQEEIQDDAQGVQDEGQEEAEFVNQLMDAIESHEGDPEELREILAAIVHEFHTSEEAQSEEGEESLEGEEGMEDLGGEDHEEESDLDQEEGL